MALLSGTRIGQDTCLSQKIFDRIHLLFPEVETCLLPARVLLANTYSSHGDFSKSSSIRMEIDQMRLQKKTGLTWTVVDGKVIVSRKLEKKDI